MRRTTTEHSLAVLVLALASGGATASNSDADAGGKCAAVADDAARLACYDAIFRNRPTAVAPEPAPESTMKGAAAAPPRGPTDDFGLTPARKESIEAAEAKAAGKQPTPAQPVSPDSITAQVATAAHRLTGELVVILDNGQVWVQIDSESKARVREGEDITIRKATLGSYFLVAPNHVLVRVRRVK